MHQKNRRANIQSATARPRPRLELLEDRTLLSGVSFSLPASFSVGPNVHPESVAVGDFNCDGKPDLVTPDGFTSSVSELLGNGDGTFQTAQSYATGTPAVYDIPVYVAVGDFNGDHKPDLVVANQNSNSISVLLGNGDGTFQTAMKFGVGSNPVSVAVGDLNGDHKLDLVVANEYSDTFSVLMGNGDGTFQAAQDYSTGGRLPVSLAIADFNGDGKADLAIANQNGGITVGVLLGNGDGTFQTAQNFEVGVTPNDVVVGDFNGDGKLDLAVSSVAPAVSVLLGNGDGTFQALREFAAPGEPYGLTVADLNGDGKQDLAVADVVANQVSVLLGNGDGTFQDIENFPSGFFPAAVVAADFNSDGKQDLAVVNELNSSVSVMLNDFVTTTSLSGPSSATYGQSVTYTAKVESGGAAVTAGVVTFVVSFPEEFDSPFTATVALDASSKATVSLPILNANTYSITAMYNDASTGAAGFGPSTGSASLTVNAAVLSVTGINFGAIAGVPFTGAIASFANPNPSGNFDAFSAFITWGDGSSSYGSITGGTTLTVSGPYTYAHAGTHPVTVEITNSIGDTTTATASLTASVSTLVRGINYWNNKHGQALIDGFNGGSSSTALATWLATSFPHLYGTGAGANNLAGETNLQVAAFYQIQFALAGSNLEAEVLATALNVYATTQSLGGTTGKAHHFIVSAGGLGADFFNVGADGAAFGVANNTSLDVYDLLKAADRQSVSGVFYNGTKSLQKLAKNLFHGVNTPGSIF